MTNDPTLSEHYGDLLGLSLPWQVTKVDLDLMKGCVDIWVEYRAGEHPFCPDCGQEGVLYDHAGERTWRHLDTMQFETRIHSRAPRCQCREHGIRTVTVPWAGRHSRFTLMFEAFAIRVMQACPSLKRACELLRIDWHTAMTIQKRAVERGIARREPRDLPHIGVDEKSFTKREMATVLTDIEGHRVWEVTRGRTAEAAKKAIASIPSERRNLVLAVAMDMSGPYQKAVREELPEAEICFDPFHVSAMLNKAVDMVRREEHRELSAQGEDTLKNTRYLFLKNPSKHTSTQKKAFKRLKHAHLKVSRAWALKDAFRHFWTYKHTGCATRFFNNWVEWVWIEDLPAMERVAKTLIRHYAGLENQIFHKISNGMAEGFNSAIQAVRACARGFRNFENYRTAILFRHGKLSMFP